VVFEDPETQLVSFSVENEVAFALENLNYPRDIIQERIQTSLAATRLTGMEKKHPHELSGGQKQRLAIAAAIALQPELLVLDEPTSQLDPVGAGEIYSTIHTLNQDHGITVVMTSHAAEEMAVYADRIALIAEGEIVSVGPPTDIYTQVEKIEEHHLRLPQVTSTFSKLSKAGIPVPRLPVRMDEALPMLDNLSKQPFSVVIENPGAPSVAEAPYLRVHQLTHEYPDGTRAIQDISLDIHKGEFVLIVGQNGAGKSTLIKHFVNLLEPTSGRVEIKGIPTNEIKVSELAAQIGFISQNPDNQIFNKTVEEEIAYAMRHQGFDPEEVSSRVADSLSSMGLTHLKDRHPLSLSKGDRARVVIGAILALEPNILIFDEPTTGQDYKGAKKILDLARELHKDQKTIIVVSHHLYLMPDYAERVIVMGQGSILMDADIRTAFHEVETLKQTFLEPPQAVQIAKELIQRHPGFPPLLTPDEIAQAFSKGKKP
jgi:energy-coupling factor transport system ATP-binding protein